MSTEYVSVRVSARIDIDKYLNVYGSVYPLICIHTYIFTCEYVYV